MPPAQKLPALLASLYLDGDRVALVLGELRDDRYAVIRAEHRRLSQPFEKHRRLHHPVHNDSDFSVFTDENFFREELGGLLDSLPPEAQVLTVLAPDKERRAARKGAADTEQRDGRRRNLLRRVLPMSPLDYPCLVVIRDVPREEGLTCTRVLSVRMAELLPLRALVHGAGREHWGTVPGLTASAEVAEALRSTMGVDHLAVMDCGALRTLFISADRENVRRNIVIPVGYLSKDKAGRTGHGAEEEIRHFARRFFTEYATAEDGTPPPSLGLLGCSDTVSELPRELAFATGCDVTGVDPQQLNRIAEGWPQTVSFSPLSLAFGGLMAAASRSGENFGALQGELVSPPVADEKCAVSRMREERLYVFEHRLAL